MTVTTLVDRPEPVTYTAYPGEAIPFASTWDGSGVLEVDATVSATVVPRLLGRSAAKIPWPGLISTTCAKGYGCRHGTRACPAISVRWRLRRVKAGRHRGKIQPVLYRYGRERWFSLWLCGRSYRLPIYLTADQLTLPHRLGLRVRWNEPGRADGWIEARWEDRLVRRVTALKWDKEKDASSTLYGLRAWLNWWMRLPAVQKVTVSHMTYRVSR